MYIFCSTDDFHIPLTRATPCIPRGPLEHTPSCFVSYTRVAIGRRGRSERRVQTE